MASLPARMRTAIRLLVPWGSSVAAVSPPVLIESLALLPLMGGALGLVAAGVAAVGGMLAPPVGGLLGVAMLTALAGGRGVVGLAAATTLARSGEAAAVLARLRGVPSVPGWTVAGAALVAEAWAAVVLPAPVRLIALVLAPMLGAWAIVVQCYGGSPSCARGPAAALIGRARFEEFGWASVIAFAGTLAVAEAAGLLVLVLAALATVGLRLCAYRRVGGMTGRLLAATRMMIETLVLVGFGVLAAVLSA